MYLTLEEIIKTQKKLKREIGKGYLTGDFGLIACKRDIKSTLAYRSGATLFTLLEGYVKRANEDMWFNKRMVLACWELINGVE